MIASSENILDNGPEQLQSNGIYDDATNQNKNSSSPGLKFRLAISEDAETRNEL